MEKKRNVWLLPTDKPSRLYLHSNNELQLRTNIIRTSGDYLGTNQHIYITSDLEIKEGDWIYVKTPNIYGGNVIAKSLGNSNGCWADYILTETTDEKGYHPSHCKKIILTTDQALIADGVQAIDDEFLEWFVKNLSCESVETIYGLFNPMGRQVDPNNLGQNHSQCIWKHKIIIPKEEPKPIHEQIIDAVGGEDRFREIAGLKPKQETLEEAAEKVARAFDNDNYKALMDLVIDGAEWQAERMYSEEEVIELLNKREDCINQTSSILDYTSAKEWFEQFKKK
jgi:hypothetical protein